jgi:hypothetical protein
MHVHDCGRELSFSARPMGCYEWRIMGPAVFGVHARPAQRQP